MPEEKKKELLRLAEETKSGDAVKIGRRMIEVWPDYSAGYFLIGVSLFSEGKLDEAEAVYWDGVKRAPCRVLFYLNLAQLRTRRNEADVLAKRLRHLALWKIALLDHVPEYVVESFEKVLGKDASEPAAYEALATYEDREVEKANDPPEVVERLRPYRLFNDLQVEAPDDLDDATLESILEHGAVCEPVLRGALREWAHSHDALDDSAACLLIAILGEISPPDAVDELIELANSGDMPIFLHTHWALNRLGMRHPEAVLERFRAAAKTKSVKLRCAIADQINLMDDVEGDVELLASLLEDFDTLPAENDSAYLVAIVVHALAQREKVALAKTLAARHESKLDKVGRAMVRDALRDESDFMPMLVDHEVDGPDIEGVCLERYFMSEEEEEEDEEEELEEDELEEEVDVEPPPPKPGRNDPCWCGSGKKYKKCHLAADEETAREQAEMEESDEEDEIKMPESLHSQLLQQVFISAPTWVNRKDMGRATAMYFGTAGAVEPAPEEFNQFIQWLLHDFRDSVTRRTPIENYLRTRNPSAADRELLESLRDARFGVWEVERIEPGSGVHMHDLFTEERIFVHDISSSNQLSRWDVLLARVQFYEGRWIFAGDGFTVPRHLIEELVRIIERDSRKAGQSKADYVRANSHSLHRLVAELAHDKLANLRVVNREGEEVEFGQAEYQVLDDTALLAKLRSLEELEEAPDLEGAEHGFNWIQPMGEEHRALGYVHVEPGMLRLEAQSRTRLQTGRGLLEFHAGSLLEHRGDRFTSVDEIKERASSKTGPERPEPPPSESERAVLLQFKTQHYAQWPDDPLPALGGKTARQAIRTADGRKAVIDLIRMMENDEERDRKSGNPAFDFNNLRRDLGLEPE